MTDDIQYTTSDEAEQRLWEALRRLQNDVRNDCMHGKGTPALREAADALTEPMKILECSIGARQLLKDWYANLSQEAR